MSKAHKEAYDDWFYNSKGVEYKQWLENKLYQTKAELEELQDYLCDYFGMEAWKAPESLLAKHIEASQKRRKQ